MSEEGRGASAGGSLCGGSLCGGCLCGGVRFMLTERPAGVIACHCSQCRRFHGHVAAYVTVPRPTVVFDADQTLSWYRSSPGAERGFCRTCGSSLFWKGDGESVVEIAAGSLDGPTGLVTLGHGYVASKGDYYEIADGLPQYPESTGQPG